MLFLIYYGRLNNKAKAYMTNNNSPLRYPGGKTKFAPHIESIIKSNQITGGDYYEVYAGGAGIALKLLFNDYCKNIHINDADLAIYSFWKSITENTDTFIQLVNDTKVSIDEWHKQKKILNDPFNYSMTQLGFATFFLNRTNRSGILKGGVIGGLKQLGNYKIDARFNKHNLIKKIKKIGDISNKIHIYNKDAAEWLVEINNDISCKDIVYLDPPYYVKGQGLYRNFYEHDDHINIRNILNSVNFNWIVSYDNNENIREMYKNYFQQEYNINYSLQDKKKTTEIIIYSPSLKIPL